MARKKKSEEETSEEIEETASSKKKKSEEPVEKPSTKKKKAEEAAEKIREIGPQPEINIGLVGHVDHGKTTLTEKLSGKWTDTHSEEIKRGITIRLGYADVVFCKCPKCKAPECYGTSPTCGKCNSLCQPLRKVSFVDAPGHESLMATMLSGANIMDGALLLVAANERCPQPQTKEHLMALDIVGVKNIIIVQNKIDLVSPEDAMKNYEEIKSFIKDTPFKDVPILPISAQHSINIDLLIQAIQEYIPTPARDQTKEPIMFVARSFDINRPGAKIDNMVGGVLGGTLKQGKYALGQEVEIRPGFSFEERNKKVYKPIMTKIVGLATGSIKVNVVGPGGSVAIMTELDPSTVKSDSLTGSVVGLPGKLPPVWDTLNLEMYLLERVVGAKVDLKVEALKPNEVLMLNVNSAATVGIVSEIGKNSFKCNLKLPVCAEKGSRVTISRMIGSRFRLIGYGIIKG